MIGLNSGFILEVLATLFVFGFAYNLIINWLERNGYDEGYTAILVVIGVLVTLVGFAAIDPGSALIMFMCFAASGFWMVIGSWWRHVKARQASQQCIRGRNE